MQGRWQVTSVSDQKLYADTAHNKEGLTLIP